MKSIKRVLLFLALLMIMSSLSAQIDNVTVEYINKYKAIAMKEMRDYKIPASITLAQGILESNSGRSELAVNARNHFGIKCHKEWEGDTYLYDDDAKNECFRVYANPEESFRDHSLFLTTRDRYSLLFDLNIRDYEGWAKGLKAAGYATDKNYPTRLIDLIDRYELFKYDEEALDESDKESDVAVVTSGTQNRDKDNDNYARPEDYVLRPHASNPIGATKSGRPIYENNGVKFIYAKEGDNTQSLAKELSIFQYQLNVYNCRDRKALDTFSEGDFVYIEKLRKQSESRVAHTVVAGETLRDVALRYAVTIDRIKKYNRMGSDERLRPGRVLLLRKGTL